MGEMIQEKDPTNVNTAKMLLQQSAYSRNILNLNVKHCPHCSKTFAASSGLGYYIAASHTEERPYQCEHCRKRFVTNFMLKRHLKTQSHTVVSIAIKSLGCCTILLVIHILTLKRSHSITNIAVKLLRYLTASSDT